MTDDNETGPTLPLPIASRLLELAKTAGFATLASLARAMDVAPKTVERAASGQGSHKFGRRLRAFLLERGVSEAAAISLDPDVAPAPEVRLRHSTQREVEGHTVAIHETSRTGSYSGRPCYRVECLTCKVELHPATTGPDQQIEVHVREYRDTCGACGHDRVFHQIGTGNGVPVGQEFCDDRHADPCSCSGFVRRQVVPGRVDDVRLEELRRITPNLGLNLESVIELRQLATELVESRAEIAKLRAENAELDEGANLLERVRAMCRRNEALRVELMNERETNARKVAQLEEDLEEVRSTRDQHAEVIGMLSREKTVERAIVEAIANADPTDPVSVLKIETTESGWQYALPAAIELTKPEASERGVCGPCKLAGPESYVACGTPRAHADCRLRYDAVQKPLDVRHVALTPRGLELGGFRVEKQLRPESVPATVEITNLAERVDDRPVPSDEPSPNHAAADERFRAELLERLASAARAVESEIKVDSRAWVPTGDGRVTTLSDWIRNHALRGPR